MISNDLRGPIKPSGTSHSSYKLVKEEKKRKRKRERERERERMNQNVTKTRDKNDFHDRCCPTGWNMPRSISIRLDSIESTWLKAVIEQIQLSAIRPVIFTPELLSESFDYLEGISVTEMMAEIASSRHSTPNWIHSELSRVVGPVSIPYWCDASSIVSLDS